MSDALACGRRFRTFNVTDDFNREVLHIENRTCREEVFDPHLFQTLDHDREAARWWMIQYSEERPHDALDDLTPLEHRQQPATSSTFELSA